MANFQTHFNVASFTSAIGATTMFYSGLVDKTETILLFSAGVIGGILPDIDSDNSTPARMMKLVLSNLFSFFVLFHFINIYPLTYLIPIWIVSYLFSILFFYSFNKITSHRGMFHSIPAGLIFWFSFSLLFYYLFEYDYLISWYFGMFIFFGYLTHLVLDEIYSVDIKGVRLKKSFGTALKFYSKDTKSSLLFYILVATLFYFMPYKLQFINSWNNFDIITTYNKLIRNFKQW